MEASLVLQRAVVAAWAADSALRDSGLRLFDGPPADARPPYATIGSDSVTVNRWVGGEASAHRFQLTVWDSSAGVAAIKAHLAEAERVVAGISGAISGWRVVSLGLLRATVRQNPKQWNQGVLEFRAVLERVR